MRNICHFKKVFCQDQTFGKLVQNPVKLFQRFDKLRKTKIGGENSSHTDFSLCQAEVPIIRTVKNTSLINLRQSYFVICKWCLISLLLKYSDLSVNLFSSRVLLSVIRITSMPFKSSTIAPSICAFDSRSSTRIPFCV